MNVLPSQRELMQPTVDVIKELGGSANIEEIYEKIVENLNLNDALLEIQNGKTGQSALQYNLAWVRTMLKNQGILENRGRGVWILKNADLNSFKNKKNKKLNKAIIKEVEEEIEEEEKWKNDLLKIIIEKLSPESFERLIQRVLREKGFSQVEITGKSGDGGIDGKGIARINGILSFHIIFQCKRYRDKVSASAIRDFRGAMVGRTDKGLFITTGMFTRDAVKEATRDGAPTIDLMDGEKLAEKLKELKLGVEIELREHIVINEKWFEEF